MKRLLVVMLVLATAKLVSESSYAQDPNQNRVHSDVTRILGAALSNKSALTFKEANEFVDFYVLATTYEIIDGIYRNAGKQQLLTSFQDPVYRVVRDVLMIILQDKITLDMKAADIVALVQQVVADKKTIAAATAAGQGVLGIADQQATSKLQDVQEDQALQDKLAKLQAAADAAAQQAATPTDNQSAAPVKQPAKGVRQTVGSYR